MANIALDSCAAVLFVAVPTPSRIGWLARPRCSISPASNL